MLVASSAVTTAAGGGALPMALVTTCTARGRVVQAAPSLRIAHDSGGSCWHPDDTTTPNRQPLTQRTAACAHLQHELGVDDANVLLGVRLEAAKRAHVHIP
jgi:hypothetical protein